MNQPYSLMDSVLQLSNYICSLENFPLIKYQRSNYGHIGAILTDTILQAGMNYRTVVLPRVRKVLQNYPDAKITSVFMSYINRFGANSILDWNHPEKPRRLVDLTITLLNNNIETEDDLRIWLADPINAQSLMVIKGISCKTVDYLKNLVNLSTVAVDRHIKKFLNNAGINFNDYEEIRTIVISTANLLNLAPNDLDHSIWLFMSETRLSIRKS